MTPYSYRDDSAVPAFDDRHPVLVFDGHCVLCSGGAARMLRWDKKRLFRFATAQSPLGHALLTHYGCDTKNFNTVLLVADGHAFVKSDAYLAIARLLGGACRLAAVFRIIPKAWRDGLYDVKARNRYKWFGKSGYCALLPVQDERIIGR